MSDPIFARPRHWYGSYSDMYQYIELSGFPLIYFDEIDPQSDNCYILTMINGENQNGWPSPRARIILWDLEWRLEGEYPRIPGVTDVWASDCWYAEQIGAQYVPLGSHPNLDTHPDVKAAPEHDVALMAYMIPRRERIAYELGRCGVRVAPRGWGEEREQILKRTQALMQVHQLDAAPTTAPQRFAMAAAFSLPLISERVNDPGIFSDAVLWSDYGSLAETAAYHSQRCDWGDYAARIRHLLCVEHPFRRCVERAL